MGNLDDIPDDVLYSLMCAMTGHPVGLTLWEETITKYPEHFPEETRARELWGAVPQKVKVKYNIAVGEMHREVFGRAEHELDLGKGIMHRINNPEEYVEYDKEQSRLWKMHSIKKKKLHKKYFGKYKIKYNG